VPPGLQVATLGGGLFGHGERYYLTPAQAGQLDNGPAEESNQAPGRNIISKFLDLFR
jgi:hypothetical protein